VTVTRRRPLPLIAVLLATASLGAFCPREPRRGGAPAAGTIASEAPIEISRLSADLSEPGGYFDTDNLISNETSYLQVADQLAEGPTGGVYVGVGPDQNFSFIARVKPRYAFIVDVRRQNLLQHFLFASFFARADDPYHYLCFLFSRPCPAAVPKGALDGIERTLEAVEATPRSEAALEEDLEAAYRHIEGDLKFTLRPQDREDIRKIARAFFDEQAEIRFQSFARVSGRWHPTYRTLLTSRSPSGRFGNFLASTADYDFVRDLSRAQRIVPVIGNFAGPQALRAIGDWTRGRGLSVSAFYLSNVEFYLMRNRGFDRFVANVRALPTRPDSVLIRACFDYGRYHPAEIAGHHSVVLLQRVPRFLELESAGSYSTDWDVCTADYVH